jgi:hypothetical protein
MSLDADTIVDRRRMRRKLTFWRVCAVIVAICAVIAVGAAAQLAPDFARCTPAATFHPPHQVVNDEDGVVISVCTGPRGPWAAFWHRVKHYD